jgi:hypothetical protein
MEPWDEDLNKALIQNGFNAQKPVNEAERFGYMLESMLESAPLQDRYGDGFFNASFIRYLTVNNYSTMEAIAVQLAKIPEDRTVLGPSYEQLAERIEGVFADCAVLLGLLGYQPDQAKKILVSAIVYYLDDRYSLTHRFSLGW